MTITPMQIYWITRLDGIGDFFFGMAFTLGFVALFCLFYAIGAPTEDPGWYPERSYPLKISVALLLIFSFSSIFIPTSKEMAAIYVIPTIANNQKVQEIPSKLLTLADEWMDSLRPKVSK